MEVVWGGCCERRAPLPNRTPRCWSRRIHVGGADGVRSGGLSESANTFWRGGKSSKGRARAPHQAAEKRWSRRFAAAHRNISDSVDMAPNAETRAKNVRWKLVGALLAWRFIWLYFVCFGKRCRRYYVQNRDSRARLARSAAGLAEQAPPRSGGALSARGSGPAISRGVRWARRIFLQAYCAVIYRAGAKRLAFGRRMPRSPLNLYTIQESLLWLVRGRLAISRSA